MRLAAMLYCPSLGAAGVAAQRLLPASLRVTPFARAAPGESRIFVGRLRKDMRSSAMKSRLAKLDRRRNHFGLWRDCALFPLVPGGIRAGRRFD